MSFAATYLQEAPEWSRLAGEPWGHERVVIEFVGGPYELTGLSAAQRALVQERFGGICEGTAAAEPAFRFAVCRVDAELFRHFDPRGWVYDLDRDYHPGGLRLAGRDLLAEMHWSEPMCGRLWTSQDTHEGFPGVLENCFRVGVVYRLLGIGGAVLHSAALARDGWAYVLVGRSGAGKSTASRLARSQGWEVLSDDLNALIPTAGGWRVEKLPFAGDLGQTAVRSRAYAVAGIYWLEQAPMHAVRGLSGSLALARLVACAPVANDDPYRTGRLLDNLDCLLRSVGVSTLRFAREPGFLSLLASPCIV